MLPQLLLHTDELHEGGQGWKHALADVIPDEELLVREHGRPGECVNRPRELGSLQYHSRDTLTSESRGRHGTRGPASNDQYFAMAVILEYDTAVQPWTLRSTTEEEKITWSKIESISK